MTNQAAISLGSNLGDRRAHLLGALDALAGTPGIANLVVSSFHETAPVGGPGGQGAFLNAAATLETTLGPEALLGRLREVEARGGRTREVRWDARTIDLDLILFDSQILDGPDLILPHPRFALRRFVLAPLAEVAADWADPITGRTVSELLANLDRRPGIVLLWDKPFRARSVLDRIQDGLPEGWEVHDMPQESGSATFLVDLERSGLRGTVRLPTLVTEATDPDGIVAEILAICKAIHEA